MKAAVAIGGDPEQRTETVASKLGGSPVSARGKFLYRGEEKFYVRGVTYGPFRPEPDGSEYHDLARVARDFGHMRKSGINTVRTYTQPPGWLLDSAAENGLQLLIGLPWEQHITFLAERRRARDIEKRIRTAVKACAGHPAVLGYAVGNEIPSPLVRWYGNRRIEAFLERLYWTAKNAAPESLVTYVNYPSTEYLELPFLDVAAFNVYLESRDKLQLYLARLQNLSGDRPLLLAEVGLDSLRNGELKQAQTLAWQGETVFASGGAGLFYFAWTDEWHRGGQDILDWKFGLTTETGEAKPALAEVQRVFEQSPFAPEKEPPMISVVVCTYNGSRTIKDGLEALKRQRYPRFEVIVIDDGSTDATAALAAKYEVRLIRVANGGLSSARNIGWRAAGGEIVAYLDDDAAPDVDWLTYLAAGFKREDIAGMGGPNLAWPSDGWLATCVDHSPGNPTHVLLTDQLAEHLPGCNMAFRRSWLEAVGGFDNQFRIAGDDVDLCWRLLERGGKLGFSPGAMVWHHRRGTLTGYWKQQVNYGKAEAMLERKWPEKYNAVGHATWNGRLYGKGPLSMLTWSTRRIYHGTWGSALFQSIYSTAPGTLASLLMLPEWYLVVALLALISACGLLYAPLRYAFWPLALAFLPPLFHAALSGGRAFFRLHPRSRWSHLRLAAGTAFLHFIQPAARLWGRLCHGLTPWRRRSNGPLALPWPATMDVWSESDWKSAEERLQGFEAGLRQAGAGVARGGGCDRWDLEVRGGLLGTARLLMTIEEHGAGKQFVRIKLWPMAPAMAFVTASVLAVLGGLAALHLEWTAWALLDLPSALLLGRTLYESASAMAALKQVITRPGANAQEPKGKLGVKAASPPLPPKSAPLEAQT